MIVVSDATPLNVLTVMGFVKFLPQLYRQVIIPPAVRDELSRTSTPQTVRDWISATPSWLRTQAPAIQDTGPQAGKGEREALNLATELKADRLLADDRKARQLAARLGIKTIGTLGLLEVFAAKGFCALPDVLDRLPRDFRIAPQLVDAALERAKAREAARRSNFDQGQK